jgi:hypothetical protein
MLHELRIMLALLRRLFTEASSHCGPGAAWLGFLLQCSLDI